MNEKNIYERAKLADKETYDKFKRNNIVITITLLVSFGIPTITLYFNEKTLLILWIPLGGYGFWAFSSFLRERRLSLLEDKIDLISNQMLKQNSVDHAVLESDMGRKIDAVERSLQEAKEYGNIIVYGDNANIVTGNQTVSYVRDVQQYNPDLSEALQIVLGHLESTRNSEAAEYFNKLAEEAKKEKRSPTVLKALWLAVLEAAPGVKAMAQTSEIILGWIGALDD